MLIPGFILPVQYFPEKIHITRYNIFCELYLAIRKKQSVAITEIISSFNYRFMCVRMCDLHISIPGQVQMLTTAS